MTLSAEEAKAFVTEMWHTYFKKRVVDEIFSKFLNRVTEDFVLIGMGADEILVGRDNVKRALEKEIEETSNLEFGMSDEWCEAQSVSEDVMIVYGGFSLREKSCDKRSLFADIDCRFTVVCLKKDGILRAVHVHLSVPNIFQTSGEFFPKFINDKANEVLQEEIDKKTAELEKLNEEFLAQEELYKTAISASDDIILIIDVLKHTTEYDKTKIKEIYDLSSEIIEKDGFFSSVYSRVHPEDKKRFTQIFKINEQNALNSDWFESIKEPLNMEIRIKHNKFGYMWVRNTVIPIRNSKGQLLKVVSHVKNINEYKRREQELHGIAIRDGLTNLYNKVYTEQAIAEILKNADSYGALFMIDIDNFKGVNDTVGHLFADDVLKMFANILSSVFRPDDIVGRFGGDEFIAFMKYKGDKELIKSRAEEIIHRFDTYIQSLGDVPFSTSCSIGISVAPQDGLTFCQLYKNADEAMYSSKSGGKHRVSFYKYEEKACNGNN